MHHLPAETVSHSGEPLINQSINQSNYHKLTVLAPSHWLPVYFRSDFKILLITFKGLYNKSLVEFRHFNAKRSHIEPLKACLVPRGQK